MENILHLGELCIEKHLACIITSPVCKPPASAREPLRISSITNLVGFLNPSALASL